MQNMPYDELTGWLAYFEKRPVGWRDDDRTFKLLQAQGVKEKPGNVFNSLNAIYNRVIENVEGNIGNSFMNSAIYRKISAAKGGEKIL